MARWPADVERAYMACETLARSHYENFPVASRLLPAAMRPHVAAVYAFARAADDIADEGTAPAAVRLALLDAWRVRLHDAVARPEAAWPAERERTGDDDIALALAHTIRSCRLPIALFDDLLSAFGQDTMTTRYASWPDVLDYCRRSANPVGRLVLRIAGYASDSLDRSSDALCTALQLTNFWQDFGRDYRAGRIYVPGDVQLESGASEADLARDRITPEWTRAIAVCVRVTDDLFAEGRAVCDGVRGRLRLELRATWLGGRRILERAAAEPDLLHRRPTLGRADLPSLAMHALVWRRAASRLAV
jgi:hydroxysqualene synthase